MLKAPVVKMCHLAPMCVSVHYSEGFVEEPHFTGIILYDTQFYIESILNDNDVY